MTDFSSRIFQNFTSVNDIDLSVRLYMLVCSIKIDLSFNDYHTKRKSAPFRK